MYTYHCLNAISKVGLEEFTSDYKEVEEIEQADAVVVRSAAMHDMKFPKQLAAIARAGAGVNNIPLNRCADEGIVVFNTPGANANAVKELVLAGMLLANRHVVESVNWVSELDCKECDVHKAVEAGKKAYVGHEIAGKTLGVIGLGAIGMKVSKAATALDMHVIGYDAFPLSADRLASLPEGMEVVNEEKELYAKADFITIHVPLMDCTKNMLNKQTFELMKDGVIVLNYSRDPLVCDTDMIEALASGKVARYVTDFPNEAVIGVEGVLATSHLGASTLEAEDNCAAMAVQEIRSYFEEGNIINSVNFPRLSLERIGQVRVCVLFKGESMEKELIKSVEAAGVKVVNHAESVCGDYGYCVLDCDNEIDENVVSKVDHVVRVRVIK